MNIGKALNFVFNLIIVSTFYLELTIEPKINFVGLFMAVAILIVTGHLAWFFGMQMNAGFEIGLLIIPFYGMVALEYLQVLLRLGFYFKIIKTLYYVFIIKLVVNIGFYINNNPVDANLFGWYENLTGIYRNDDDQQD
jgi:hypothetical protein